MKPITEDMRQIVDSRAQAWWGSLRPRPAGGITAASTVVEHSQGCEKDHE
ncbi:hypothetical protein [Streptomyces sp. NPDC003393]